MRGYLAEPPPQEGDASVREPAVGLQLRLAGAARADTATEPLEVLPHAPHSRQVVFQLRQLDLELALRGHGVLGEDVEDQLRPVDDARRERVLERTLLRRVQLVVDEEHLGIEPVIHVLQLLELALADVGSRVGRLPSLDEFADRRDACGSQQLAQLAQLLALVHPGAQHGDDESALGLRPGRGVRLVMGHKAIMPGIRP